MELRSCSHSHFVQALLGGEVTKLLNISHGRPALKFRVVKDLYEDEDTKHFEVNPAIQPNFECVDLPFERDGAKAESLCTLTREAQKVKSEDETSESKSQANAVEESGLGDCYFTNITLKQIKERCKEKKRKRSKDTTETCSPSKDSHFNSQFEDEDDTMEPLICWKSRILKKKKTKKNSKKKIIYASSQNSLSIANFEEISTKFIYETEENSPAPIAIKVEFPEPIFSDCKALVVTCPESPMNCIEPVVYYGAVSPKGLKKADGYELEARTFSIEPHIAEHLLLGSGMPVVPGEELMTNAFSMDIHMPSRSLFSYVPQISSVNEEPDGAEKFVSQIAIFAEKLTSENGFETQVPALLTNEPHFCTDNDESYGNEDDVDVYDKEQHQINNFHVPDVVIDDSHEVKEPRQGNGAHIPDDEAEVHNHVQARIIGSPARDCGSLWNSKLGSTPNCSTGSVVDCTDESLVTKADESHRSDLQHPPERLLSTRMAISPTSQKKLREAMEANELDPERYYKLARKLCYGKLIENKTGRLEGSVQIKKAEVINSPKKAVRKPKTDSNDFHHNDNIKVPHASCVVQYNGIGGNSGRSCPESAILFSQQQLRDIESITAKLTKQLQFMKDIAEETLQYPAASLRYSQNEIKIALRNATRTEESAKRSLSVMARDCSRFCKIMKLAEKGSGSSSSIVRKRRKIVFADEAGGKLCDVKVFENDMHCE